MKDCNKIEKRRNVFFILRGHRVCLVVDTSSQHAFEERKDEGSECEEDDSEDKVKEGEQRSEFAECKRSLTQLFEEQLSQKNKVYILETGSEEPDVSPTPLNFRKNKQRFAYYNKKNLLIRKPMVKKVS